MRVFFAALVVGFAAYPPFVGFAVYPPSQALPLDQPLATTTHIIYAPGGLLAAPSDPGELGLLSRIARVAGVPFGFEADDADPRPATGVAVGPHRMSGGPPRSSLVAFVPPPAPSRGRDVECAFVPRAQ